MKAHGLNPRIRKSPFFASTLKYGATEFHPYNGMWMPVGYDTPINEYWNTIERAGLWDVAVQRIVEISGGDARDFMDILTPRGLSKVGVGDCRYTIITNQDGGILNDPVLLHMDENKYWLSTADNDMYLWAKGVAVFAGMDVQIETPHVYPLQIQGPKSPAVVSAVFGDQILDLKYYTWMNASVGNIDVVISRTGFSSEVGFEVYLLGKENGDALWEIIIEAGEPHGISPGSPNRIRRIEGGVLDYGSDIIVDNNPFEMGLERLVSLDKPANYIGKRALQRIADTGVSRKITGAFMGGEVFEKNNEHRWRVTKDGVKVGEVTSAVYSPRLKRNIGFVLADIDVIRNRNGLEVDTPEGIRDLEITDIPFIDANKTIPRQTLR
ncbi:MAG: glycine cleavage system protein T [Proteobacteria bacterium]|nr:MAG: glycine cleavage system protein T [Pseudomonadota bacterium]